MSLEKEGAPFLAMIEAHHHKEREGTVRELLIGIPKNGGHCSRESLADLIRAAFIDGVLSERESPFTPQIIEVPKS